MTNHFPSVNITIEHIQECRRSFLNQMKLNMSEGSAFGMMHIVYASAIDRSLSNIDGILLLFNDDNFLCCASVLRMQIDTAMRVNSFYLVDDPTALAVKMMEGVQFSHLKDRDGNLMKDFYLRRKLAESHPWVDAVYKETSGAVHLSNRHIFAASQTTVSRENTLELSMTGKSGREREDYAELLAAFLHSVRLTHDLLFPKQASEEKK